MEHVENCIGSNYWRRARIGYSFLFASGNIREDQTAQIPVCLGIYNQEESPPSKPGPAVKNIYKAQFNWARNFNWS